MTDWLRLGQEAEEDEEYWKAAEYYQKADAGNIEGWIAPDNFYDDVQANPEKARAA